MNGYQITPLVLALVVISLACLGGAIALQMTGNDASKAWEGFTGALTGLIGVHVPQPRK